MSEQAIKAKKPTRAQLRWLRAIDMGAVKRSGHSWVNPMLSSNPSVSGTGRSNYVMTCALHDAGWIDQEPVPVEYGYHYRLVLTPAGRAASGLPSKDQDGPFYIASLKHTSRAHEHITFWGPDYRGYRLAINDETIGRYSAEYIATDSYHLSDGVDCLAVPESIVKPLLSPMPYFAINGRVQQFYDTPGPVVDNTRENWARMIAAAFWLPAGVKPKPEVFRGKRSSFALPSAQEAAHG